LRALYKRPAHPAGNIFNSSRHPKRKVTEWF
jgi:hypothetical protein